MRRTYVAVVAALLMAALLFPTAAGAKNTKVDVCHSKGNGTYHLINISENAVGKHIANHDDGLPGDPVPGMENLNFSSDCLPVDITKPVVTAPDDLTEEATSTGGAVVNFTAIADDAVDGPLDPTCDPPSGDTFPVGDTTVTCTATDNAGNTGSDTFTVTVERSYLVRATSTDDTGTVRVISELLDTNGDGVPSVGDTVKLYEYPTDFTGTSYSPFWTTTCIFDNDVTVVDNAPYLYVQGRSSSDPGCDYGIWIEVDGLYQEYYARYFDGSVHRDVDLFDGGTNSQDFIYIDSAYFAQRLSNTDDPWLDLEFNFTP